MKTLNPADINDFSKRKIVKKQNKQEPPKEDKWGLVGKVVPGSNGSLVYL